MAEKAQAEPTMEEILASIRKIIADDGEGSGSGRKAPSRAEPAVSVNVSDDDSFDDLSLDDVIEQSGGNPEKLSTGAEPDIDPVGGAGEEDLVSDIDDSMFDDLAGDEPPAFQAATEDEGIGELEDFDLDTVDLEDEEPVFAADEPEESFDESDAEWETSVAPVSPPVREEPQPSARTASMLRGKTESVASSEGLTDERIAGAAASALGKLMVKQSADEGNPNTLDGLMKELLRPMIKEWLDANLPAIVERKVEEEVQRIARMAR